jgi:hypothetical protein
LKSRGGGARAKNMDCRTSEDGLHMENQVIIECVTVFPVRYMYLGSDERTSSMIEGKRLPEHPVMGS